MSLLVALLQTPVAMVLGAPLTVGELAGFVTGLGCVWLAARGNVLNFPVGIVNSALLLLIFAEARLFADATLQVLFIALGVDGWLRWSRGKGSANVWVATWRSALRALDGDATGPRSVPDPGDAPPGGAPAEEPVRHLSPRGLALGVGAAFGLTLLLLPILAWARGSLPVFDAAITALSVVAQVLLNTRKVESWYFWILVDLVSVPVYAVKGLYLIAVLYLVFLGLACRGAWRWRALAQVA